MTEVSVYQGRARRRCPDCGVEIEIEKPTRVLSRSSNPAWRKAARKEVARQIAWELLCSSCRCWWNARLRTIETGPDEGTRDVELAREALAGMNPSSPRAARERARLAGCEAAHR